MKTLIAIPCMDTVPTSFAQSLLWMKKGGNVSVCFKKNSLVYDSRNLLSLTAIEQGYDRVLWIDSDMVFTPDAFMKLSDTMTRRKDIHFLTGIYFQRQPGSLPVIFDEVDAPTEGENGGIVKHIHEYMDYPKDALFKIKGCGFGFCLTTTRILKDVWTKFGPAFSPYPWAGEDISFCHRANLLGYKLWCDSSLVLGHEGRYVYMDKDYLKNRGEEVEQSNG